MDGRRMQRLVGMVVLFTITFLGVLLVANNPASSPFRTGGYDIYVDVPSAKGVAVNTPVRKDGVLVGRVSGLEWTDDGVRLKVRIDRSDVTIFSNDKPSVEPSSILGDAVVSFTRESVVGKRAPILAEAVIKGSVTPDPLTALTNLGPSVQKLGEAGDQVAILADKINTVLGDDIGRQRIQKTLDELTLTLQDFRRTTNNFDRIISDEELRQELTQALREFPPLMAETRSTMQRAGKTLDNFDAVIASAEKNLINLEGLTEPLGEQGEEIAELLISSIDNLDIVMKDLSRFTTDLNSSQGLVGRLVKDKKLGDDAAQLISYSKTVISNANIVVCNLNKRIDSLEIDKILRNIQIFTDKISREPGRLIGGVVNPSIIK